MPEPPDVLDEVTFVPAVAADEAWPHFESLLALETDGWDVHEAMTSGAPTRSSRATQS